MRVGKNDGRPHALMSRREIESKSVTFLTWTCDFIVSIVFANCREKCVTEYFCAGSGYCLNYSRDMSLLIFRPAKSASIGLRHVWRKQTSRFRSFNVSYSVHSYSSAHVIDAKFSGINTRILFLNHCTRELHKK